MAPSGALALLASAALVLAAAGAAGPARAQATVPRCTPDTLAPRVPFTGLYPAIENRLPLSSFRRGQIVEIDPRTMSEPEARQHIRELQGIGAQVSIYLVGGHCDLGRDCDSLPKEVKLATTGSWNWDRSERRIIDITHGSVLDRLARGIEGGWRLGANFIRIDNLHHPAGSTHPRTAAQMEVIIARAHDIEDRLRAVGAIESGRVTGLVAHNNLLAWEELVTGGKLRRWPVLVTSERTAQLAPGKHYEGDRRMKAGRLAPADVPEIAAGRRLALQLAIPYTIVEFRKSHDLAGRRGDTYPLPQAYVDMLARLPGVTEVVVMTSESHYVGRGEVYRGTGPAELRSVPQPSAPQAACSLAPV
jgi:hypothetical protein